jgi:hypothetical protein
MSETTESIPKPPRPNRLLERFLLDPSWPCHELRRVLERVLPVAERVALGIAALALVAAAVVVGLRFIERHRPMRDPIRRSKSTFSLWKGRLTHRI